MKYKHNTEIWYTGTSTQKAISKEGGELELRTGTAETPKLKLLPPLMLISLLSLAANNEHLLQTWYPT